MSTFVVVRTFSWAISFWKKRKEENGINNIIKASRPGIWCWTVSCVVIMSAFELLAQSISLWRCGAACGQYTSLISPPDFPDWLFPGMEGHEICFKFSQSLQTLSLFTMKKTVWVFSFLNPLLWLYTMSFPAEPSLDHYDFSSFSFINKL